ncbi:MAG: hypothetical protein H0U82_07780 [Actinobacteria bacterium]|nr:hypothetical protein [Actinomycetota bacterium]
MATSTKRGQSAAERRRQIAERGQQVVELYGSGMSVADVAKRTGCHPQTARADLGDAGVLIRGTNKPQTTSRTCERDGCENVFRPTPAQLRKGFGKYCTRACDHEAHRIHPQAEERVCARDGCEERFTPTGSNVAMGWGKFHSKRCSALSTDAHRRKKGREVECRNCGKTKWRYDSTIGAGFCSHECWGKYRWRNRGETISPDVVSLVRGSARQKWYGRWNAHKGAAAGIEGGREGGRPAKATKKQAAKCWSLHGEGRSTREIAAIVFGDARYKDRVARIVRR